MAGRGARESRARGACWWAGPEGRRGRRGLGARRAPGPSRGTARPATRRDRRELATPGRGRSPASAVAYRAAPCPATGRNRLRLPVHELWYTSNYSAAGRSGVGLAVPADLIDGGTDASSSTRRSVRRPSRPRTWSTRSRSRRATFATTTTPATASPPDQQPGRRARSPRLGSRQRHLRDDRLHRRARPHGHPPAQRSTATGSSSAGGRPEPTQRSRAQFERRLRSDVELRAA